jgi:hypothetical protein
MVDIMVLGYQTHFLAVTLGAGLEAGADPFPQTPLLLERDPKLRGGSGKQ